MQNTVVILNSQAVADATELCSILGDYQVYLFDIALSDPAAAAGLKNVKLFTQISGPAYHAMHRESHAAALTLERYLDAAQFSAGSEVSIVGWQHLNLYYFFMMHRWYTALWDLIGEQLHGCHVHVLINDNPAEYYFDSFVPPLSLVAYLKRSGIPFTAYDYGAKGIPAYAVPDLVGTAPASIAGCLLTHLPTCFYDGDHFGREIRAAGLPWVDVKACHWNIRLQPDVRLALTTVERGLASLDAPAADRIDVAVGALRDRLSALLAPHVELPNYRLRQVEHWAQLYRAQLVTHAALQRYFGEHQPSKLLLADHDAGFLGPLIAFAEQRSLPVLLLPHSKVIGEFGLRAAGILALTHPLQGGPLHDLDGCNLQHRPILFPERFAGSSSVGGALRTVCLILNAPSLNGVPDVPGDTYLEGIRRIVTWCRDHEVAVKIRSRPGYPIFRLLNLYIGADIATLTHWMNEPLEQHALNCDLCLMYEGSTTGAIVFLRNSIPILNPTVSVQSEKCAAMLHTDVVVAESLEASLRRLEQFKAEPLSLDSFRIAQFQAYLAKYRAARPLRTYLGGQSTAGGRVDAELPASLSDAEAAA